MAKRHLEKYFLEQQSVYIEMLENLPEYKALLQDGIFSEEQYNESVSMIDKIKNNYETIAYMMFLLNKPNRKGKKESAAMQYYYDGLEKVSEKTKFKESKDCLEYIKKLIKEGKINE